MNSVFHLQPLLEQRRPPTAEELAMLKNFRDGSGHAVSFYFKTGHVRDPERDLMALRIKARAMISHDFESGRRSTGLLRDLDRCLETAEVAVEQDAPLKVIFACHDRGIWLEYELPSRSRGLRMETGEQFNLAPLLRRSATAA